MLPAVTLTLEEKKIAKKDKKNSDQVSSLLAKGGLRLFFHLLNIYWVLAPVQKLCIAHTCNSVFWSGLHSTHPTMVESPMYANTVICSKYSIKLFWTLSFGEFLPRRKETCFRDSWKVYGMGEASRKASIGSSSRVCWDTRSVEKGAAGKEPW